MITDPSSFGIFRGIQNEWDYGFFDIISEFGPETGVFGGVIKLFHFEGLYLFSLLLTKFHEVVVHCGVVWVVS